MGGIGALAGIIDAQYQVLRKNGHSASEAFNETVEELTESLIKAFSQKGLEGLLDGCSLTAQRGALDWRGPYAKAVSPVFEDLYQSVKQGKEAQIIVDASNDEKYKQKIESELGSISNSECWQVGKTLRKLRPNR